MAAFTLEKFEFFLAIFARITAFVFVAPIFSLKTLPHRVKALISIAVSVIIYSVTEYKQLEYVGVIGFALLISKEVISGLILGLFGILAFNIISMAGHMIDMEVGLSNTQELDPTNQTSVTITSTFLNYAVLLIMVVTNMHLYILKAVTDSFKILPPGHLNISGNIFELFLQFIISYMIIAFRIVLPEFAAILVVNTVLAVLAKAAPQMNMFVIGFQLKIFVGLAVLTLIMLMLPAISDMIFNNIIDNMRSAIPYMGGG